MGSQPSLPKVDLEGKTVIVTGANTGIGYETAKTLAQAGAKVIMACRSEARANQAIERMKREHAEERADPKKAKIRLKKDELDLEFMTLDLGSLASTMEFAHAYKAKGIPLHILICNAGIAWSAAGPTADGFECHFQINYLSHFLLTLHLLPVLKASGPGSRIVNVASMMYRYAKWDVSDLQSLEHTDKARRYSNTKLYQIMQMFSLAQRLEGSGVSVFSLHPGVVHTEIHSREGQQMPGPMKFLARLGESANMFRTPFAGALTSLHAAANPDYEDKTALYFQDSKPKSLNALPRNKEKQEIIWKFTLDLLKDHVTEDTMKEMTSS